MGEGSHPGDPPLVEVGSRHPRGRASGAGGGLWPSSEEAFGDVPPEGSRLRWPPTPGSLPSCPKAASLRLSGDAWLPLLQTKP